MKQFFLLVSLFFFTLQIQAQQAKKYVLLEHFTNTRCGICASKNPAFFNTINQYQDIHHIAYHPRVPYPACELYQHNTAENTLRADYYNIFGTPKVFLNGVATGPGPLITTTALDNELMATSPIGIGVSETLDETREVTVDIKTFGTAPTGNLKLYVAILEKELDYNAPNGESVHHDVFRKFLADGTAFTPAADGETVTETYTYTLDAEWEASEIYVMAYLQDDDTKAIINSGNRFDEALPTSNKELSEANFGLDLSPNPASNQLFINLENTKQEVTQLRLQDVAGRQVWSEQSKAESLQVNVQNMPNGVYFLSIQRGNTQIVEKVLVQH